RPSRPAAPPCGWPVAGRWGRGRTGWNPARASQILRPVFKPRNAPDTGKRRHRPSGPSVFFSVWTVVSSLLPGSGLKKDLGHKPPGRRPSQPLGVLNAEQAGVVGPHPAHRQAGGVGQPGEGLAAVLVRVLGADALAGGEADGGAAEVDRLGAAADEVHLDAA